ncbi:MAG: NAD-dependent protein deacetylase [Natronospirillum sp.]|uniref:NAD-dependent protein deacetylase n=1 Tax=Natronospirillum sp. TaxID=2812955 RepID=UPI0025E66CD8|nr:NAD-dependent protein deacetylase [Natronospirillum sp.]MCH8552543.1 NAD-dependent protein deacetylase [Natronospirillum sp.]
MTQPELLAGRTEAPEPHRVIDPVEAAEALLSFLQQHGPLTLLTGAGISTDSGIPDYRDGAGAWKRKQPVQHLDFMQDPATRQRYWARSLVGWPVMQQAQPNAAHEALTRLQQAGLIGTVITQNVDRLHQRAGTRNVIDLHGRADEVLCMSCGYRCPRVDVHDRCSELNPDFRDFTAATAPDGDADLEADFTRFRVADCPQCAGVLKPDVVYFGDNVPRERVNQARQALENSAGLLVIGSSLMVFSGFRFCRYAEQAGLPIALLNRGRTRADDMATLKLDCAIGPVLGRVAGGI